MNILGVDTAARIGADKAKILYDNGVRFAGRYLVPPGMNKHLTADEAAGLRAAGLAILLCWEIGGSDVKGGREQGLKDGSRAKALAQEFGVPAGVTIYFACDYGAPVSDYPVIEEYIRAAQEAAAPYVAGLYGHAGLVNHLAEKGACAQFWQCTAWSYGQLSPHADVYQYQWSGGAESKAMAAKVGFAVDMNVCGDLRAAGLWLPPDPEPETHWYDATMRWGLEQGIITEERPTDFATRAEVVQMIRNYNGRFEQEDYEDMTRPSGLLSD